MEGSVKLVTITNPFTKKLNKLKKVYDKCDQLLLENASGMGNLSKTLVENNLGIV